MKVALASDDGRNISAHFGRAEYYVVVEIEDGEVLSRRLVPKENHYSLRATKHAHRHRAGLGCDERCTEELHRKMLAPIADCQLLVVRSMGAGPLHLVQELGASALLTDIASVDDALRAYLAGRLLHHPELVH